MDRVRIGVVGCGLVAQTMHLPNIQSCPDVALAGLSDVSPGTLQAVATRYGVPNDRRFISHEALLGPDIDAIMVLTTAETHARIAEDALAAGKHVFVEKPMCTTPSDADRLVAAAERSGNVLMVGYMKAYDPGFVYAQALWADTPGISLLRVHDICHNNAEVCDDLYGSGLIKGDDLTHQARVEASALRERQNQEALGWDATPPQIQAYHKLLGLMTHDLSILMIAFGEPRAILTSHIWQSGQGLLTTFDFGDGRRCIMETVQGGLHWMDESITAYSAQRVVALEFPSPFQRNAETIVRVKENDGVGHSERVVVASRAEAFARELDHFVSCIRTGHKPLTDGRLGKQCIELSRDIVLAAGPSHGL